MHEWIGLAEQKKLKPKPQERAGEGEGKGRGKWGGGHRKQSQLWPEARVAQGCRPKCVV